jgi:hypothetical protein
LKNDYSILEIKGESIFPYDTTYFDTADDRMYINHHNGKRNRFKIRVRQYVVSNDNFLEIKFKNNKGRTLKERIKRQDFNPEFKNNEFGFLKNSSPYSGSELQPKILSFFNRITLVDNAFTVRVTIDTLPGFKNEEKEIIINDLVIIEIKQNKNNKSALINQVLRSKKVRRQGFSKYCIGRSLLEDNIKKNKFKPLLIRLKKEYLN